MTSFWTAPLSRPIPLRDEATVLVTLRDGADLVLERFVAILKSVAYGYTIALLTTAADTGAAEDIEAATAQLERFLRGNQLA